MHTPERTLERRCQQDLGYSSAPVFITMFRRMTGTTLDKVCGQGLETS